MSKARVIIEGAIAYEDDNSIEMYSEWGQRTRFSKRSVTVEYLIPSEPEWVNGDLVLRHDSSGGRGYKMFRSNGKWITEYGTERTGDSFFYLWNSGLIQVIYKNDG